MIKVIDSANEVIETGKSIDEVIKKLNSGDSNDWYFVYRPESDCIDGYYGISEAEADADTDGEKADAIYDVEEEETAFYRNKEDGTLTLGYPNMDVEDFEVISPEEVLEIIDNADTWDAVDADIYRALCELVGLKYENFDDPDILFDALKSRID